MATKTIRIVFPPRYVNEPVIFSIAKASGVIPAITYAKVSGASAEFELKLDGTEEAMDKALSERPDLILLDVVMPVMDGFEVCRKLRAQEATRSIPIIMVTTRGEERHIACAFEAGCNDYITKPISGLELVSKVSDHLNR